MAKLSLTDLASLENQSTAMAAINANNALIETAMENTLSRDGTSPNTMGADLDMNSNNITNLPAPASDNEPVRKVEFDELEAQVNALSAGEGGGSSITPAALTKTDDTNVTLTLGGTPTTALLEDTSLTLGWTGTLAVARGGTGAASAGAAATALGLGTGNSPQFTGIELSHATANTLTASGGVLSIEGVALLSTATGQPLDADLTAIAALTTTTAGRSVLTVVDNNLDQLLFWDDSATTAKTMVLADMTAEASPAAGDFVIIYGAEGDVRKANWSTLPGAGAGISNVVEDVTPQLGGDLDCQTFDILFGTGGVINFNAGDVTVTHSANTLTIAGGITALDASSTVGGSVIQTVTSVANTKIATITYVIDGGGSVITTGIKGDLEIPFACTINRVTLLADQSGSIVVDIWKDIYANYPPTIADTITASALPTISATTKSQDSTLTGWTTAITAGDTLRFNVNSASSVTRVTLSLKVTKT